MKKIMKHETKEMKQHIFFCFWKRKKKWKRKWTKQIERKKSEKVEGGEYSFIRANHETEYILRNDRNQFKWFNIILFRDKSHYV